MKIGWKRACVIALAIVGMCVIVRPPLVFYTFLNFSGPRLLPLRHIRGAIRYAAHHDLPAQIDQIIGACAGGRGAMVFVRFHADSAGIQKVLTEFGPPGRKVRQSAQFWIQQWHGYATVSTWQAKLGVPLLDRDNFDSATVLAGGGGDYPYCTVLIDNQRDVVYMLAWPCD